VPLRDILHMASGHKYDENNYFNVTQGATATTIRMVLGTPLTVQAREAVRDRPPGTRWNYDSMNSFATSSSSRPARTSTPTPTKAKHSTPSAP
jgi:hypothetical protein